MINEDKGKGHCQVNKVKRKGSKRDKKKRSITSWKERKTKTRKTR